MNKRLLYMVLVAVLIMPSCRKDDLDAEIEDKEDIDLVGQPEIADWAEATHSNEAEPNYTVVFDDSKVQRFDIKIDAADWAAMQADLESGLGSAGGGGGGRPGGGGGGMVTESAFDPIWVTCSFFFDDKEWYEVGIRFKGNSSLSSSYSSGVEKLSFKLDFDQFEDDYPVIENQRFYGFKQLNLKNNFDDASMVREKVACELFRSFGLASPEVSFCEVYVDFGEGAQYFGLYSLVEEVDDTVIETQYESSTGNLYKPDGDAASFADGTYDAGEMEKKNNEELADYSDVESLYAVINSSDRESDAAQWRANLEEVLDIEVFLKWLAANTVMQNWDTYGRMTHNYYLYNNPLDSKLNWIPWDNNEALQFGKQNGALSLALSEVGDEWPLIRYIMDEPTYEAMYKEYLLAFNTEIFSAEKMDEIYTAYYDLLKESAYAEVSPYSFLLSSSSFDQAFTELKAHVQERNAAVETFLN